MHCKHFPESHDNQKTNTDKYICFHEENRKRNGRFSRIGTQYSKKWTWTQTVQAAKRTISDTRKQASALPTMPPAITPRHRYVLGKNHFLRWEVIQCGTIAQPSKWQDLVRTGSWYIFSRITPSSSPVCFGLRQNLRQWQDTSGFPWSRGQNRQGSVPTPYPRGCCTSLGQGALYRWKIDVPARLSTDLQS